MALKDGFTNRQLEIIRAIVSEFVVTGEPVGSKILVEKFSMEFSSATVRKEMSVLEQMGLLLSPHTSAGRVPTDVAFQLYVTDLVNLYEITLTEKDKLESFYRRAKMQLDQMLQTTAQMLAATSEYAGVVLSPISTGSILKRIELVSLHDNLILIIMVSGSGSVYQKRVQLERGVTQEELYKVSRFLNQRLVGYELADLQERGLEFLEDGKGELEELGEIALLVAQGLVYNPPDQEVYLEGESVLHQKLLRTLPQRANAIMEKLENRGYICDLMNRMKSGTEVAAQFGLDVDGERIDGISVLTKGYSIGGRNMGALGVIGLSRMPYEKLIPTLNYSSELISNVLSESQDMNSFGDEHNRTLPGGE